ncbi:hypothetical protein [Pseudomonas sp. LFM046]|uniref:hypothetical protein n=1 Tax=Pseudomonas sp. LFM046 TaxID=1608357 RepID=UPI0005CFB241|nr:hypothetical protein [Pseudomonas sp. LFM046]
MSGSEELKFHFVDLRGDISGPDENPASATDHHSLSINRTSVHKLIATRESSNTGEPLPATTPSPREESVAKERISSLADAKPAPTAPVEGVVAPAVAELAREQEGALDTQPQAIRLPTEPAEASPEAAVRAEPWQGSRASINGLVLGADFSLPSPVHEDTEAPDVAPHVPEAPAEATADRPDDAAAVNKAEVPLEPQDMLDLNAEIKAEMQPATQDDEPEPTFEAAVEERPQEQPLHAPQPTLTPSLGSDTDNVLSDVQSTLNSLADMAKGLTQQKQDAARQQESLEQRKAQLHERERQLADKEEQLRLLETRLAQEVATLELNAQDNARALAERSAALKALAENVEARDRATAKMADNLRLEKQRYDELAEALHRRLDALDEREAALNRRDDELAENLKQLVGAKDRFRNLVRTFNETVQFNNALNAISGKALED